MNTLQVIANICTIVAAITTIFAARVVVKQLNQAAWLKAQEIWMKEDFTASRERLFRSIDETNRAAEFTLDDCYIICRNLDEFCRLAGHFTLAEHMGRERLLETWSNPVAKAWTLLRGFVRLERQRSQWNEKWRTFETTGVEAFSMLSAPVRDTLDAAAKRIGPHIDESFRRGTSFDS